MKTVMVLIGAPCSGKSLLADLAADRGHHVISPHQTGRDSQKIRNLDNPLDWEGEMNGKVALAASNESLVVLDSYPLTAQQSKFIFDTFDVRKWRFVTFLLAIDKEIAEKRMQAQKTRPEYQDKRIAKNILDNYDENAKTVLPRLRGRSDKFEILEANTEANQLAAQFLGFLTEEENLLVDRGVFQATA